MKTAIIAVIAIVTLTACSKRAQQSAVDTALRSSASQASDGGSAKTSGRVGTEAPATMPAELLPADVTISASATVADGYQASFTANQTIDQLITYYKGLTDWTVSAEFSADASQTLALERSDQRAVVTMTPKGSGSADVVVTGSFVKE